MLLREKPTEEDWYQVWKAHPSVLPGFDQRQSSRVYKGLGLNPQIAKWAGLRSFVTIVNKGVPLELQRRIRGDGGSRNAGLVGDWRHRETAEAVLQARAEVEQVELARGKQRRSGVLTVRQGQPEFRSDLLAAYEGRCAISDVSAREALQAAHIEPYDGEATNVVTNGLLLRADLHNLFDAHLLWIDDDLIVRVAASVTDASYRQWDGQLLRRPADADSWPNAGALRIHRLACSG